MGDRIPWPLADGPTLTTTPFHWPALGAAPRRFSIQLRCLLPLGLARPNFCQDSPKSISSARLGIAAPSGASFSKAIADRAFVGASGSRSVPAFCLPNRSLHERSLRAVWRCSLSRQTGRCAQHVRIQRAWEKVRAQNALDAFATLFAYVARCTYKQAEISVFRLPGPSRRQPKDLDRCNSRVSQTPAPS